MTNKTFSIGLVRSLILLDVIKTILCIYIIFKPLNMIPILLSAITLSCVYRYFYFFSKFSPRPNDLFILELLTYAIVWVIGFHIELNMYHLLVIDAYLALLMYSLYRPGVVLFK